MNVLIGYGLWVICVFVFHQSRLVQFSARSMIYWLRLNISKNHFFFVGWIYDEDGGWFESLPLDSALWIRLTASIFGATDEWRWKIIDNSAVYFSFVLRFVWFWTQELRAFSLFASSLSLVRPLKSILFIKLKQPSIFCFSFSNFQTY